MPCIKYKPAWYYLYLVTSPYWPYQVSSTLSLNECACRNAVWQSGTPTFRVSGANDVAQLAGSLIACHCLQAESTCKHTCTQTKCGPATKDRQYGKFYNASYSCPALTPSALLNSMPPVTSFPWSTNMYKQRIQGTDGTGRSIWVHLGSVQSYCRATTLHLQLGMLGGAVMIHHGNVWYHMIPIEVLLKSYWYLLWLSMTIYDYETVPTASPLLDFTASPLVDGTLSKPYKLTHPVACQNYEIGINWPD